MVSIDEDTFIRDIAKQYLRKFASASGAYKTIRLRDENGKLYIATRNQK